MLMLMPLRLVYMGIETCDHWLDKRVSPLQETSTGVLLAVATRASSVYRRDRTMKFMCA